MIGLRLVVPLQARGTGDSEFHSQAQSVDSERADSEVWSPAAAVSAKADSEVKRLSSSSLDGVTIMFVQVC